MRKAFTLLEILVVMAIIGLLAGLGMNGMNTFMKNTEAEQATQELIGFLKETQTKAKNNTIPSNVDLSLVKDRNYFYWVYTTLSSPRLNLERRLCYKLASESYTTIALDRCQAAEKLIFTRNSNITTTIYMTAQLGEIKCGVGDANNSLTAYLSNLYPPNYIIGSNNNKYGIIFEHLTGRILYKRYPTTPAACKFGLGVKYYEGAAAWSEYSYIIFGNHSFKRVYQ